jgi:radical SAM/Cys-rich protein
MPQRTLTLLRAGKELSDPAIQRKVLWSMSGSQPGCLPTFESKVAATGRPGLRADRVDILQVNVGRLCNQTCRHCHVDAGPERREIMSRETAEACIRFLERQEIGSLDLTGGAPEMNPNFRWMVTEARRSGRHVIDRCNLTILLAPGFDELPEFLAENRVEIVASLPCYLEENCDRQRGDGVYGQSIAAIRRLNELGYGRAESGLVLTLVYNPIGPSLPPPQADLEDAYRRELQIRHAVEFNRLFTITNMPISRFLDDLCETGQYEAYMRRLVDAFNPETIDGLMCRNTLSVDWEGYLYDCDFNQMLDLSLTGGRVNIRDVDGTGLARRAIATGPHCFGCTAGCGSGCQGAIRSQAIG